MASGVTGEGQAQVVAGEGVPAGGGEWVVLEPAALADKVVVLDGEAPGDAELIAPVVAGVVLQGGWGKGIRFDPFVAGEIGWVVDGVDRGERLNGFVELEQAVRIVLIYLEVVAPSGLIPNLIAGLLLAE